MLKESVMSAFIEAFYRARGLSKHASQNRTNPTYAPDHAYIVVTLDGAVTTPMATKLPMDTKAFYAHIPYYAGLDRLILRLTHLANWAMTEAPHLMEDGTVSDDVVENQKFVALFRVEYEGKS
jgi:hypothetical protein